MYRSAKVQVHLAGQRGVYLGAILAAKVCTGKYMNLSLAILPVSYEHMCKSVWEDAVLATIDDASSRLLVQPKLRISITGSTCHVSSCTFVVFCSSLTTRLSVI